MTRRKLPEGGERFTPPEPNAQGPSTQTVRRTGSTSPFWWVIRCRCHYWVPPFQEWHYSVRAPGVRTGDPKQSGATVYPRRRDAVRVLRRLRADEPKAEFRLVKVWARWVMPEERDRSRALHEVLAHARRKVGAR
jgi:hypothetical protein